MEGLLCVDIGKECLYSELSNAFSSLSFHQPSVLKKPQFLSQLLEQISPPDAPGTVLTCVLWSSTLSWRFCETPATPMASFYLGAPGSGCPVPVIAHWTVPQVLTLGGQPSPDLRVSLAQLPSLPFIQPNLQGAPKPILPPLPPCPRHPRSGSPCWLAFL